MGSRKNGAIKTPDRSDSEEGSAAEKGMECDEDSITVIADRSKSSNVVTFVYRKKTYEAEWKDQPKTHLQAGAVIRFHAVEKHAGGVVVLTGDVGSFLNPDEDHGKDQVFCAGPPEKVIDNNPEQPGAEAEEINVSVVI